MPLYEYRCRTCAAQFDARRSFDEADAPAPCPDGHIDSVRLLAAFASTGRAGAGAPLPMAGPSGGGGGCGSACGCHGA